MSVSRYISHITSERRFSVHTLKAYLIDLTQFQSFIHVNFEIEDLNVADTTHIKSWIAELKSNGIDNRSINRKMTTLRSYYHFCLKEELISKFPMNQIKALKTRKRLPVFVPQTDLAIIDKQKESDTFENTRNKLIIELLYQTGIRLSELIQLNDNDLDTGALQLKVTGKRNKQRIIPVQQQLSDQIQYYIKLRNAEFTFETKSLFITRSGKRAYPEMINRIVHRKLNQITTVSKTSPHILRHTFATHLLNQGADLLAIKELLGHSSLSATQVYTHNTIEQLKKIHQQAHPKG